MNKHHREDRDHGHSKKKHMSSGGMVGERVKKACSYDDTNFGAVNAMLSAKHPTTNLATTKCGGGQAMKLAAGGIGKVRKDQY
jgi:hypothetical protein